MHNERGTGTRTDTLLGAMGFGAKNKFGATAYFTMHIVK